MSVARWIVLVTANIGIGIFSFYLYIFFWVSVLYGENVSIHPLFSIPMDVLLFIGVNVLILRKQNKAYGWIAFLVAALTATAIVSVIGLT